MFTNPFVLCFITLPILTVIASILLKNFIKNKILIVTIVAVVFLILTFTIFNESFLFWVVIYSIISLISVSVIGNNRK